MYQQGSQQSNALVAGTAIYAMRDRQTLVRTPSDVRLLARLPCDEFISFVEDLNNREDLNNKTEPQGTDLTPGKSELLASLRSEGCLKLGRAANATAETTLDRGSVSSMLSDVLRRTNISDAKHYNLGNSEAAAALYSDSRLVVSVHRSCEYRELARTGDVVAGEGFDWLPLVFDQRRAWAGPLITPERVPDYRDVLKRRLCAARNFDIQQAEFNAEHLSSSPRLDDGTVWSLSVFADCVRDIIGRALTLSCELWELRLDSREIRKHPILPLPEKSGVHRNPCRKLQPEDVVDNAVGIVTRLDRWKLETIHAPRAVVYQSTVADMSRLYPWSNCEINSGYAIDNDQLARTAAIGEGLERYCGNYVDPKLIRFASYTDILESGGQAVDPTSIILFSNEQYNVPGFPFVPFTRDLKTHWISGVNVTKSRPAWVPACLAFVNWHSGPFGDSPKVAYNCFSGNASGRSYDYALTSALEELIERDTVMAWWLSGSQRPAMPPPDTLRPVLADTPKEIVSRLFLLENEFKVPVVAAAVDDRRKRIRTVGFAARASIAAAAEKAWLEAAGLHETATALHDVNGAFWKLDGLSRLDPAVKPRRDDRRYLDSYRPDYRDVVSLYCQLQANLDPRAMEFTDRLLHVPEEPAHCADLPARSSNAYRSRLEARGYEVYVVDQTTFDVAATGWYVLRAVVPGLVPNFATAFPPLGRQRVQRLPQGLGWQTRYLRAEELNYFPMPHA